MHTRTLVSLPDDDKAWLDREAASRGEPMTHLVREAVAVYRVRADNRREESLDALLDSTAGLFGRRGAPAEGGDALQRRLRDEWDRVAAPAPRPRRAAR